jgi:hypothetical protein
MDLMLALSEDSIHDVMWTDDLLDERERVIVREHRRSPDAAAAITATIREFFADTRITAENYRTLITDGQTLTADVIEIGLIAHGSMHDEHTAVAASHNRRGCP